jgi:hypothetical protein
MCLVSNGAGGKWVPDKGEGVGTTLNFPLSNGSSSTTTPTLIDSGSYKPLLLAQLLAIFFITLCLSISIAHARSYNEDLTNELVFLSFVRIQDISIRVSVVFLFVLVFLCKAVSDFYVLCVCFFCWFDFLMDCYFILIYVYSLFLFLNSVIFIFT